MVHPSHGLNPPNPDRRYSVAPKTKSKAKKFHESMQTKTISCLKQLFTKLVTLNLAIKKEEPTFLMDESKSERKLSLPQIVSSPSIEDGMVNTSMMEVFNM
jgi:site-specific recombinase XerD